MCLPPSHQLPKSNLSVSGNNAWPRVDQSRNALYERRRNKTIPRVNSCESRRAERLSDLPGVKKDGAWLLGTLFGREVRRAVEEGTTDPRHHHNSHFHKGTRWGEPPVTCLPPGQE